MRDYLQPMADEDNAPIIRQHLLHNFEIKTYLINMINNACQFSGSSIDNPHLYLNNFKEICSMVHYREIDNDAIKLMLFPFSLCGGAKS